jgi:hypothetical protein
MKKILSKAVAFIVAAVLCVFALASCAEERSALSIMTEFCDSYSVGGVIYSPLIEEGRRGHSDERFFIDLYGEGSESVSDYSVLLLSGISLVGECAVFLCYSDYDATLVSDMCYRRIELLKSLAGAVDTSFAEDAFVLRRGKTVVMCALSDNEKGARIWKKVIQS